MIMNDIKCVQENTFSLYRKFRVLFTYQTNIYSTTMAIMLDCVQWDLSQSPLA